MGFLAGKRLHHRACSTTVRSPTASRRPVIAKAPSSRSATRARRFKDRITEFAAEFGSTLTFDCDVGDDAQIDALFSNSPGLAAVRRLRALDRLRAARGDRRRLPRRPQRENFRIAHDISACSFPAMAKAALPPAARGVHRC